MNEKPKTETVKCEKCHYQKEIECNEQIASQPFGFRILSGFVGEIGLNERKPVFGTLFQIWDNAMQKERSFCGTCLMTAILGNVKPNSREENITNASPHGPHIHGPGAKTETPNKKPPQGGSGTAPPQNKDHRARPVAYSNVSINQTLQCRSCNELVHWRLPNLMSMAIEAYENGGDFQQNGIIRLSVTCTKCLCTNVVRIQLFAAMVNESNDPLPINMQPSFTKSDVKYEYSIKCARCTIEYPTNIGYPAAILNQIKTENPSVLELAECLGLPINTPEHTKNKMFSILVYDRVAKLLHTNSTDKSQNYKGSVIMCADCIRSCLSKQLVQMMNDAAAKCRLIN